MAIRYFLVCETKSAKNQLPIVGQLFIKTAQTQAELSENGGPIQVFEQDGVITVKIEAEVKDVFFNSHLVKKGGLYFFEDNDSLTFKDSKIYVQTQELFESKKLEHTGEYKFSREAMGADALKKFNSDDTDISFSMDKGVTSEKIKSPAPKASATSSSTTHAPAKKSLEKKQQEVTRTSINIDELLNNANSGGDLKLNASQKNSDKNQAKLGSEFHSAHKVQALRPKKERKIEVKKKFRAQNYKRLVGPFARFFNLIANITIVITLYNVIDISFIEVYFNKVTTLLENNLPQVYNKIPSGIDLNVIFKIITLFILLELVSSLLFSVSLPLFLTGATSNGNFLTKRLKAVLRTLIGFATLPLLIFDLPLLMKKRTIKETLTLSGIEYRFSAAKFLSLLILPLVILVTLFSNSMPFVMDHFKEFEKNASFEIKQNKSYDHKKTQPVAGLRVANNLIEKYYIIGTTTPKFEYFFTDKVTGNYFHLSEIMNYPFTNFSETKNKIPFFDLLYPDLANYLENNEDQVMINVRKDVLNFIQNAETLILKDFSKFTNISFISLPHAIELFQKLNLFPEEVSYTNEFFRIYKIKDEIIVVLIARDSIKILNIESNIDIPDLVLSRIAASHFEEHELSGLDLYIQGKKNFSELNLFKENVNNIESLIENKDLNDLSGAFKGFYEKIISKLPPEKHEFVDFMRSQE